MTLRASIIFRKTTVAGRCPLRKHAIPTACEALGIDALCKNSLTSTNLFPG